MLFRALRILPSINAAAGAATGTVPNGATSIDVVWMGKLKGPAAAERGVTPVLKTKESISYLP
jgi:hypothetical protein